MLFMEMNPNLFMTSNMMPGMHKNRSISSQESCTPPLVCLPLHSSPFIEPSIVHEMLSSPPETAATGCDPVLSQLMGLYSDGDAIGMVATLDQIVVESSAQASRQQALGSLECVNVIFSFFASIAPSSSTQLVSVTRSSQSDISSTFLVDPPHDDCKELQRQLIEKCYWVLVRLCRRGKDKSTANASNIEIIENYNNSFTLINVIAAQYTNYARIALPAAWLVMILASDSAERQFKLTAAGTTQLIVSIINSNLDDNSVTEMSCKAARNLAAGEADLVAKFVEDKVCDALVRVIHKQLGTIPPLPHIEEPESETKIESEMVLKSENDIQSDGTAVQGDKSNDIDMNGAKEDDEKQPDHKEILTDLNEMKISNIDIVNIIENLLNVELKECSTSNDDVCESVLWAIVNLTCEENVALIFGSIGGIEAIVLLAQKYQHNSDISTAAISAIRNISSVGSLNYSFLIKTKVCEVILDILKEHSSDFEIIEIGLWTITNLACDTVLSNRLCTLGVAPIILDAYFSVASHHPPEGRPCGPISEGILWAIVNLSAGGLENEDKLGCVGVVDLVGCIMETYSNREGMFDLALNALIHLIYHSEDNKMRVGNINVINNDSNNGNNNGNNGIRNEILEIRKEKKIFSTVCNIIEKYEDNENIAENIFQFFLLSLNGNINSNNLNKEKLLSLDILIIISKIMSTNSIHSEVIRLGCGLLLVLRFDDETYKEKLRGLDQLDERGKAKPKGSYEDIARIWECTDSRAVSTDVRLMTGSSVSSIHMLV